MLGMSHPRSGRITPLIEFELHNGCVQMRMDASDAFKNVPPTFCVNLSLERDESNLNRCEGQDPAQTPVQKPRGRIPVKGSL